MMFFACNFKLGKVLSFLELIEVDLSEAEADME